MTARKKAYTTHLVPARQTDIVVVRDVLVNLVVGPFHHGYLVSCVRDDRLAPRWAEEVQLDSLSNHGSPKGETPLQRFTISNRLVLFKSLNCERQPWTGRPEHSRVKWSKE